MDDMKDAYRSAQARVKNELRARGTVANRRYYSHMASDMTGETINSYVNDIHNADADVINNKSQQTGLYFAAFLFFSELRIRTAAHRIGC